MNRSARPADTAQLLSNEQRLLLLCARTVLDPEEQQCLVQLLAGELDWPALLAAAERHYIEPLLARHLLGLEARSVPSQARSVLLDRQRALAMECLQLVGVQQQLVEQVLAPRGVRHAFAKGAALAQAYYGDPAGRRCRDIDVLLDAQRIGEVGEALAAMGFEVANAAWSSFRQRRLDSFSRYCSALEMRSPRGVLVELHRSIDATGCIFDSGELLERATLTAGARYPWRSLCPADMFVYLCYHHARHRWSSLHWCADLEAMSRHPSFDAEAVERLAASFALESTVVEARRLAEDLRQLALGCPTAAERPASRFLDDCLESLRAAFVDSGARWDVWPAIQAAGERTAVGEHEPDFQYPWQSSARYRRRFRRLRWRPSSNDVNAWPLPLALHWLYFLIRPLRITLARLRGWLTRTPGATTASAKY